mgnify:CR=1 FL=1
MRMGVIEKEVAREIRREKIQYLILGTLAGTGLVATAALAPGVLGVLDKIFGIRKRISAYSSVNRAINNALVRGYVVRVETAWGKVFRITPLGRAKLQSLALKTFKLKKPRRWDGRFRLIIFDIREKLKGTRDKLSLTLKRLGLLRLQDSVWVYPYDCEDFLVLLKADMKVGQDVLYVVAQKIENDWHLRKHFNLPLRR